MRVLLGLFIIWLLAKGRDEIYLDLIGLGQSDDIDPASMIAPDEDEGGSSA